MNKKISYALSFLAPDSRGIVSRVAEVLYENGFNIADSTAASLSGVFSVILIVTSDKDYSEKDVARLFEKTGFVPAVFKPEETDVKTELPGYSVSVYGADKPGIVMEIASCLAENGVNISEMQTRITGKPGAWLYVMILEAVPENPEGEKWIESLKERAARLGTNVTCEKIESYRL